jgi:hypothetical protein
MLHWVLKRVGSTVMLVVHSALERCIQASGREVGLETSVDRRRGVLLKPCV